MTHIRPNARAADPGVGGCEKLTGWKRPLTTPPPEKLQARRRYDASGGNRNSVGPCPLPTKTVLSSAARLPAPLVGEENDDYAPLIASLNDAWRVIVCKNSLQWVLQQRRGARNHWRGSAFCCTREALLRNVRERGGEIGGDALVILLKLPERIGGVP